MAPQGRRRAPMRGRPMRRDGFGPWADGFDGAERLARLRAMRALAFVFCGPAHPLTMALLEAEADDAAAIAALDHLDALPALRRRRLLAAYAALSAPCWQVRPTM
jgi:hypothetical protein